MRTVQSTAPFLRAVFLFDDLLGDLKSDTANFRRAIWEVFKEERLHVSIPYAEMVHFSATMNRREAAAGDADGTQVMRRR